MANYTYPEVDTLKNKLGVRNSQELGRIQGQLVAARVYELTLGHGPEGHFDAEHLKAIHEHLFQDVYEWAGHTRDEFVALSDGTVASEPDMKQAGLVFLAGHLIARTLDRLAIKLAEAEYLHGLPRDEFASRAADIMAVLAAIHPFREGNGPTQRMFLNALAAQAGHSLDFTVVSKERMLQVSMAAVEHDNPALMRRLFNEISDPSRVAALRQAIELLEKGRFPWNDRYLATAEPGQPVELRMVGPVGDYFMGRTGTRILIGNMADLPSPHPQTHQTFVFIPAAPTENRGTSTAPELPRTAPADDVSRLIVAPAERTDGTAT